MTYNFDPDNWYDMERSALEARYKTGEINAQALKRALEDLDRRHNEMLVRLDGTYQIPK